MRVGTPKGWVKHLEGLRSDKALRVQRKARNRVARTYDPSYSRRQSLGSLYSKELSHRPTSAEILFGNYLVELKVFPFQFQKPILKPQLYILDFYLPKHFVAFEIDGSSHDNRKIQDEERDVNLWNRGIKTYRFTNDEVYNDSVGVKKQIQAALSWS